VSLAAQIAECERRFDEFPLWKQNALLNFIRGELAPKPKPEDPAVPIDTVALPLAPSERVNYDIRLIEYKRNTAGREAAPHIDPVREEVAVLKDLPVEAKIALWKNAINAMKYQHIGDPYFRFVYPEDRIIQNLCEGRTES
jgi:hypothetical protein